MAQAGGRHKEMPFFASSEASGARQFCQARLWGYRFLPVSQAPRGYHEANDPMPHTHTRMYTNRGVACVCCFQLLLKIKNLRQTKLWKCVDQEFLPRPPSFLNCGFLALPYPPWRLWFGTTPSPQGKKEKKGFTASYVMRHELFQSCSDLHITHDARYITWGIASLVTLVEKFYFMFFTCGLT